jgi:two-component system NtrC family response regulator
MNKILVVDDEIGVRESLRFALKDKYKVILADCGKECIAQLEKESPDLIILDIILPDIDGISLLKEIRRKFHEIPVVMLTAVSQVKTAVEAMKSGAVDYITKPFDVEEIILIIEKIFKTKNLLSYIEILKEEINKEYPVEKIIYASEVMKKIIEIAKRVSFSDSPVLITGPTGVGKELIARYIHENSPRKNQPFVPIHCAAIPETLFESELFGHEKGAFTNAFKSKKGKIEIAGSGTIFLDEIGEIPLNIQVKLLRFIEEKKFSRLGSNEIIESDVRIISATSKNLEEEIKKGSFREDLYYRLSVVPIKIPPLKERKEDIIPLLDYYTDFYSKKYRLKIKKISERAKDVFLNYEWPGNIRELKNVIERIFVLNPQNDIIDIEDLPDEFKVNKKGIISLKDEVENFEKNLIKRALEENNYNQTKTAMSLKTTRRILRYKIEKYGLLKDGKNSDN